MAASLGSAAVCGPVYPLMALVPLHGTGYEQRKPTGGYGMEKALPKYIVTDGELTLLLETAEEGGYVVTSPFNPDILTEADTLEEAFEMARDVIETYKEYRAGRRAPAPKREKSSDKSTSKKTA
jgi:predicted RNase H-like HicB family nuclease